MFKSLSVFNIIFITSVTVCPKCCSLLHHIQTSKLQTLSVYLIYLTLWKYSRYFLRFELQIVLMSVLILNVVVVAARMAVCSNPCTRSRARCWLSNRFPWIRTCRKSSRRFLSCSSVTVRTSSSTTEVTSKTQTYG